MNITNRLQSLLTLYGINRRKGSTTAMIEGVKQCDNVIVVSANRIDANRMRKLIPEACHVTIYEPLEGLSGAIAMDNHAIVDVLQQSLAEIRMLEREIAEMKGGKTPP